MNLFLLAYCIKILMRCTHKCMIKVKEEAMLILFHNS